MSDAIVEKALGVHFSGRSLRAVELSRDGDDIFLSRLGYGRLYVDTDLESLLQKDIREKISAEIKSLVDSLEIEAGTHVTSIGGQFIFVGNVPWEDPGSSEMSKSQIIWEAQQFLSSPVEEYEMNYLVSEESAFIVAIRKKVIDIYSSICSQANLDPLIMDFDYFALFNSYELAEAVPDKGNVAFLSLERYAATVVILKDGIFSGARSIMYPQSMDKPRETTLNEIGVTVAEGLNEIASVYLPRDRSFDQILLSGSAARIDGIVDGITSNGFENLRIYNPFDSLDKERLKEDDIELLRKDNFFVIALGLARRGLEG